MTHYVYIPGLGDRFDFLRRMALQAWRRHGVRVTFVPMRWNDRRETYEQKYARVAEAINSILGDKIILVGESAGGAMAILAFYHHPVRVSGIVTVCGYNHGASDIMPYRRQRTPALYFLTKQVDMIIPRLSLRQRRSIKTIFSLNDHVVTSDHSSIKDAQKVILKTHGHMATIASVLVRFKILATPED